MEKMKVLSKTEYLGDMLICFILCHGQKTGQFKCGSSYIQFDDLVKLFYSASCRALLNKPKVFICLHCRGGLYLFSFSIVRIKIYL